MRFRTRVAIEAPVKSRTPTGQETVSGYTVFLESIPANVQTSRAERIGDRFTTIEDMYDIDIAGHHTELTTEMVVLDGEAVYDIKEVVPTLRRELTTLKAERIAI